MIASTNGELATTNGALPKNAVVSTSISIELFGWLMKHCYELHTTRSAFLANLIADARAREAAQNQEPPCPPASR